MHVASTKHNQADMEKGGLLLVAQGAAISEKTKSHFSRYSSC